MHKKFIKKSLIFILMFLVITPLLGKFLLPNKNATLDGFYYEKENTIDVLFFGSSHSYMGVNPNVIWDNIGVTSYNLGQPEQPIWVTYNYMKEALKYQKPKAIFMDVYTTIYTQEYMPLDNSTINLDTMKMSLNKLDAIQNSVEPSKRPFFALNLLKNKSSWKNISESNFTYNFKNNNNLNKGYIENSTIFENEKPPVEETDEIGTLPPKVELYLNKIIDLCKEEDIPLVFIKTPVILSIENKKIYNKVNEIAQNNNIDFINFNHMYDEIDIDFKKDFMDCGIHLNFMGAHKISDYLSTYISNTFSIESKKGKEDFKRWEDDSNLWKMKEEGYLLSLESDTDKYKDMLNKDYYIVGLTYKDADKDHLVLARNNKLIDTMSGTSSFALSNSIDDKDFYISFKGGVPSIKINDEEYISNPDKLNFVVYDTRLDKVVHSK